MVDQLYPTDRPAASVCPWCSTSVTPETATCPSCGAILLAEEEPVLPGVTAVDPQVARPHKKPSRSKLLAWISGDYTDDIGSVGSSQALAPPDVEVQREILRLELEATVANLQAEADAILSEAAVEGRELPEGIRPYGAGGTIEGITIEDAPEGEAPVAEVIPADEATAAGAETSAGAETPADPETPAETEAAADTETPTA